MQETQPGPIPHSELTCGSPRRGQVSSYLQGVFLYAWFFFGGRRPVQLLRLFHDPRQFAHYRCQLVRDRRRSAHW